MWAGQSDSSQLKRRDWHQTVTTLVGIFSVLLVAAGLFYTNAANRAQQKLAEQGQVTDRFGTAIDQLGSGNLDVRLGGVYALERLMHDASGDEANIIEVLSAYIRDHTGTSAAVSQATTSPAPPHPSTDVQATLTVLGRRPDPASHVRIDLTWADLTGADLTDANLADADLREADLAGGYLRSTDLVGAALRNANLAGAYLRFADLAGAYLRYDNLTSANLRSANLAGANLSGAKLTGVQLTGANLTKARWPRYATVPQGWARDRDSGLLRRTSKRS
jgi:Pentapeptide repeats (8 copies)